MAQNALPCHATLKALDTNLGSLISGHGPWTWALDTGRWIWVIGLLSMRDTDACSHDPISPNSIHVL